MTLLRRTLSPRRFQPILLAKRNLHNTARLPAGKESKIHNENRAAEAEASKQDSLKKVREGGGRGEWKDDLASDSESNVKADRNEYKDSKDSIREMQQEGAKAAEEEKRKGS